MWGSSSTSGLPRLVFQFQSIYLISSSSLPTSYPVPVYLPHMQFQSTYLISSSSLPTSYPVPVYFFQHSSSSLLLPRTSPVCGAFFLSCLYTMQVHLDWLIFVGSSLYKDSSSLHVGFLFSARTHLHSLLILMAVTSLKCSGFLCECVCVCAFQLTVYFLLNVSLKCCSFILNCILKIIISF